MTLAPHHVPSAQHNRHRRDLRGRRSPRAGGDASFLVVLVRIAGWVGLLAAAHHGLLGAGAVLPAPPLRPDALWHFLAHTDATLVAFGLLRLVALAITWYLTAVTALAILGRASRLQPLVVLADRVAVPALRRTLHRLLGAGLAVSLAAGVVPTVVASTSLATTSIAAAAPATPAAPGAPAASPGAATMELIFESPTETPAETPPVAPTPTVRMRLVPDTDSSPSTAVEPTIASAPPVTAPNEPTPQPSVSTTIAADTTHSTVVDDHSQSATPPSTTNAPVVDADPTPSTDGASPQHHVDPIPDATTSASASDPTNDRVRDATWTIVAGDHLWHVASATLTERWGRPPSNQEIARYLGLLIDANRQVLVVRDNPDLVFPGQVFTLPAVPAAA